jgi:predicted HTH transcriptional regulator
VRIIGKLLDEWETTSVEFKRELYLDTKDQKAEFIKDILGLANTQASGERLLIIGFDDKTRAYHAPPDMKKITADNIERVLAQYTAPVVEIKHETLDYGGRGIVGIVRVKRDRAKLPYKPAASFGDKKRISENQIFVRHSSQTQEATQAEIESLEAEAMRAKPAHIIDD